MRKEYLGPVFIMIAFAGFSFFVLPQYRTLTGLSQERVLIQKRLAETEAYFARLGDIQKRLASLEQAREAVDNALPSDISVPRLFTYFQKAVSENGLLLEGIGVSPPEARKDIKGKLAFVNLRLLGSYSSLKIFLQHIEHAGRLFNVPSVVVERAEEHEIKNLLSIMIKLEVYAQAGQGVAPGAESGMPAGKQGF